MPPRRNPRRKCNIRTASPSSSPSPSEEHHSSDSDDFQPVKRSRRSRFALASRRPTDSPEEEEQQHSQQQPDDELVEKKPPLGDDDDGDDEQQSDSDFELDKAELDDEIAQLDDADEAKAPGISPSASRRSTSTKVPARKKRHAAARKQTKMEEETPIVIADEGALSDKHRQLLSQLFDVLDQNDNNRITLTNVMSVADDHGIVYSYDEVRDMIRFWTNQEPKRFRKMTSRVWQLNVNSLHQQSESRPVPLHWSIYL